MTELTRPIRRLLGPQERRPARSARRTSPWQRHRRSPAADDQPSIAIDIPESDPLLAYLQAAPGPVDIGRLELESPAVTALRAAGVALVVPLVSQGELIGTLNLGPRLSEQDYSTDDRRLLDDPRRPGGAGDPRRPARPRAGRTRPPNASGSSRRCGSRRSSSSSSCRASCRTCRVADRRLLRPGPRGRWRLLRLHRDARRADRHRRRRRHRQGRAGGAGHGPDAQRPSRRGDARRSRRARSSPAPTSCSCRRCRPGCS